MTPYRWIENGPTSTVPLCGEGMLARKVTRQRILPAARFACRLQQDFQRQLGRAALREHLDRRVEIDVLARRELGRAGGAVAGQFQLFGPPGLDELRLVANLRVRRSHLSRLLLRTRRRRGSPLTG